jgi:N-acetylglucosamine malate deacetylase 2
MKPVVAIFAHPDDEAFGPSGTLAQFAQERDVYLICITDGAAGFNSSQKTQSLEKIREAELLHSAKILGIKQVFFLKFGDGTLSNNLYHEIVEKLEQLIRPLSPEILLTYELRGVSGHLDHIAVSFITTYLFKKLADCRQLWQYAITKQRRKAFTNYYIYFPEGYDREEFDKIVDVSSVWEQKLQAMYAHESQKHDIEQMLAGYRVLPKEEAFFIRNK